VVALFLDFTPTFRTEPLGKPAPLNTTFAASLLHKFEEDFNVIPQRTLTCNRARRVMLNEHRSLRMNNGSKEENCADAVFFEPPTASA